MSIRLDGFDDPQQLINVVYRSTGDADDSPWFNYPLFERMRNASREHVQFFAMSFPSREDAIFDDGDRQPEKVYAQWISGDAFGNPQCEARPRPAADCVRRRETWSAPGCRDQLRLLVATIWRKSLRAIHVDPMKSLRSE